MPATGSRTSTGSAAWWTFIFVITIVAVVAAIGGGSFIGAWSNSLNAQDSATELAP